MCLFFFFNEHGVNAENRSNCNLKGLVHKRDVEWVTFVLNFLSFPSSNSLSTNSLFPPLPLYTILSTKNLAMSQHNKILLARLFQQQSIWVICSEHFLIIRARAKRHRQVPLLISPPVCEEVLQVLGESLLVTLALQHCFGKLTWLQWAGQRGVSTHPRQRDKEMAVSKGQSHRSFPPCACIRVYIRFLCF